LQHCTRVYDPVPNNDESEPVAFNVDLNKKPKKLVDIKGAFSGVYFGGCCKVVLCEPQTLRENYVLREISTNETPFLHDMRLLGPQQGVALTIDCSTMSLCKDDSSNFLRFEGIHLACYEVSRWITGPTYRNSVNTRYGRTSRQLFAKKLWTMCLWLRVIKSTYDGGADLIHLLTLYDVANVDGCTTAGAEPDPEWITVVISIRGVSGEIYKITPIRKIDYDALKRVELDGEDEILVLTCYDGKNTIAEMYCLREEDAKNWPEELSKVCL
ncbi:hypothetical protein OESDEN_22848, partial [Oesophagostomum dentatum]